jgi:hypothetical protein
MKMKQFGSKDGFARMVILAAFVFFCPVAVNAQEKSVEHNFRHGLGAFNYEDYSGMAWTIAYGPDFYINSNWSVMPELECELMHNGFISFVTQYGLNSLQLYYVGLAGNVRYHFGSRFMLSVAPTLHRALKRDLWVDFTGQTRTVAYPWDFGGKINADFSISKHWRLGLEAYCGTSLIPRLTATVSYVIL